MNFFTVLIYSFCLLYWCILVYEFHACDFPDIFLLMHFGMWISCMWFSWYFFHVSLGAVRFTYVWELFAVWCDAFMILFGKFTNFPNPDLDYSGRMHLRSGRKTTLYGMSLYIHNVCSIKKAIQISTLEVSIWNITKVSSIVNLPWGLWIWQFHPSDWWRFSCSLWSVVNSFYYQILWIDGSSLVHRWSLYL